MERDPERLRQLYAGWKTEELVKAITANEADYEPDTINIIKEELQSRNVTTKDLDIFHENYLCEERAWRSQGKLFCPKCHSLNIGKEKRRWLYLIIGPLLAALLPYRCNDCGYLFEVPKD